MSGEFQFRLFDRERFLGLRPDLVSLSKGEVTARIARLLDEAEAELERAWWREVLEYRRRGARDGIEAVRRSVSGGTRVGARERGPAVQALLDTLCHVRFEDGIVQSERTDGTFLELDAERLMWALWQRLPWLEQWAWGFGAWAERGADDFNWADERAITVMSRVDLERLHADIERIATEPGAVPEVVADDDAWRTEHRIRAFVTFRRLVRMAVETPGYSLSLQTPL